ncbi:hypothetical protein [Brevundimonas subvibrioides]|uniref:hypothetical protein n=1 Tax=Brevundimonas subvibrioides TaxID=74313 RepID=UPI0022B2AF34|nr:hypothetical protein [Brevundimonas subvibrioides]
MFKILIPAVCARGLLAVAARSRSADARWEDAVQAAPVMSWSLQHEGDLASRGRMAVLGDAGSFQLMATADERRAVGDFLSYCSMGRA